MEVFFGRFEYFFWKIKKLIRFGKIWKRVESHGRDASRKTNFNILRRNLGDQSHPILIEKNSFTNFLKNVLL